MSLGVPQPPLDHFVGVGLTSAQALLERCARGRQNKNARATRHGRPHLPRPLPIDFQHHVVALGQPGFDGLSRGTVEIVEDTGMLRN